MAQWWRAWVSPELFLPPRLVLLGFAIEIQGYEVIPSDWLRGLIGPAAAAMLSFLFMSLTLICICLAVRPGLPIWLAEKPGKLMRRFALIGCLVLGIVGLGETGVIVFECFQAPIYYNDGALLDHNAALLLLHGQNPYTQSDIISAIRDFHQSAVYTTPLQQGKLADQQDYPSNEQLQALLAQEPLGHSNQALEFESHVSYPALSFLVLIPLVWAGAPTVISFYLLCLVLLAIVGLHSVRHDLRWWVALLFLADLPVINSALSGSLDIFCMLLLFLAWRFYRRWWASAALLGLALASKQTAWFYLPFYLVYGYQSQGFRDTARRFGLAGLLFVVINLPFIVMDARAWAAGVLAPMRDPMFPEGSGLIALSLGKLLPFLPREVYIMLEGLGMAGALTWYWRRGRECPEAAMVLAVLPLFLAWRSLPSYFDYCALPIALLLSAANGGETLVVGKNKGKDGRKEGKSVLLLVSPPCYQMFIPSVLVIWLSLCSHCQHQHRNLLRMRKCWSGREIDERCCRPPAPEVRIPTLSSRYSAIPFLQPALLLCKARGLHPVASA